MEIRHIRCYNTIGYCLLANKQRNLQNHHYCSTDFVEIPELYAA